MQVIHLKAIHDFCDRTAHATNPLERWLEVVRAARWARPADLRQTFRHADLLGGTRVVFNVGGNRFRISTDVHFAGGVVFIRRVMTHEEYSEATKRGTL